MSCVACMAFCTLQSSRLGKPIQTYVHCILNMADDGILKIILVSVVSA